MKKVSAAGPMVFVPLERKNVSSYLVLESETMRSGETLGYSAEQKLPITLSQGVYVEGQTLKIGF